MNSVEAIVEVAQSLQDKGQIEQALQAFSQAFDLLIDQAGQYARTQEAGTTDLDELRTIAPRLFEHSRVFLKKNIMAAYLLNAMGVLFAQLKDYDNAQQKFLEALSYIPDNTDYGDPADNLERIAGEIAALNAASESANEPE
jgi:tetratricopeptide (TPR) repeat protein